VAAAGLLAVAAIPANAADVVYEEPPAPVAPMEQPPINTWAGPYAGISIGYGFGGRTNANSFTTPRRAIGIETDGLIVGGFAGYNLQNGGLVYGFEGDVNYNGIGGHEAGTGTHTGVDGSLRARFGYAVTDSVLLYATGGGALERKKISDPIGSDTAALFGYTVGAGIDAMVTQNVFGRLEYRWTDYGSKTMNTGSGAQRVDSQNHRVTVGMGVKF
jgi:outer membrane immunogenic protein